MANRRKINILFIFPLNEPYETIIGASKTAWKSKLNLYKNIKKLDCAYPTGLLSIASYVTKHVPEADIKILDLNAVLNRVAKRKFDNSESFAGYGYIDFLAESLALTGGFVPDITGISTLFCSNYQDLAATAAFIRKAYQNSLVVCGGHLASACYERMYADGHEIDAIGFGEGEVPFRELAEAAVAGRSAEYLSSSPSWITKDKILAGVNFSPRNALLPDLDEIPPFDFNLLLFPDAYFNSTRYFFVIDSKEEQKEMFLFSSRGCQYKCVFCASQNVHGNKLRLHSVERIKSDILYYNRRYGVTRFVFYDDHFLSGKERAVEILEFIRQKGFTAEIPTPAFFSVDPTVAAVMGRGGIKEVNITIESGNQHTLKAIMHKPGSLKKAEEAVDLLHKEGIIVVSNILIGLPGETKESIESGLAYLMTTHIDWFQCFVVAPLPGSELYQICSDKGYLVPGYDLSTMDYKKCLIRTPDFSPEYIENKVYEMNLTLNFTNNYNMRAGRCDVALMFFERVINSVIDTHAFAYYFAAQCCAELRLWDKYMVYKAKYEEMTEKYEFWRKYASQFKLKALD